MDGLKKPGLYVLCDVINYCCTALGVSDSGGWYELLYSPAKKSVLFCLTSAS